MAKADLGVKRIDPETGRKFYDLNKDPIVSPYTGRSYPRSYFESVSASSAAVEEEEVEEKEAEAEEAGATLVSLEDADEETKGSDEALPDIDAEDDVELDDDEDDDTFLAEEEEEDDDMGDIIGVGDEDDES